MHLNDITGSTFSIVMLLSLVGAFIHETGMPRRLSPTDTQTEIGFGIYIYYPVLYTDVSEAWKLSRQRRALIDVGGVYFQSVFQFLLLSLFFVTGSPILIYFFLFNDLIMFRTMNPFLRMDGYWLVADLFGIYNLREQSTKLIKHYVLKLFNSGRAGKRLCRFFRDEQGRSRSVFRALSFLLLHLRDHDSILIVYLVPTYPTRLLAVWQATQASPFSLLKLLSLIFEVLWRTAVLCGLSIFAYRLVKNVWGLMKFLVQTLLQKLLTLKEDGTSVIFSAR